MGATTNGVGISEDVHNCNSTGGWRRRYRAGKINFCVSSKDDDVESGYKKLAEVLINN